MGEQRVMLPHKSLSPTSHFFQWKGNFVSSWSIYRLHIPCHPLKMATRLLAFIKLRTLQIMMCSWALDIIQCDLSTQNTDLKNPSSYMDHLLEVTLGWVLSVHTVSLYDSVAFLTAFLCTAVISGSLGFPCLGDVTINSASIPCLTSGEDTRFHFRFHCCFLFSKFFKTGKLNWRQWGLFPVSSWSNYSKNVQCLVICLSIFKKRSYFECALVPNH